MKLDALRTLGAAPVTIHKGTTQWRPVGHSRELSRVLAIPRRQLNDDHNDGMRDLLQRPQGSLRLWDVQCRALVEAIHADGLFAALPVGTRKTLIGALLPTVLDKRAVYLTTPSLKRQVDDMLDEYRDSFHVRDDLVVESYSALSSQRRARLLEDFAPELIVADECHALAKPSAARTKRFLRYMKRNPETVFCGLTGSMVRKSLRDFAHLLQLALRDWTPLPRDWPTLTEWAEALDVGGERPAGALAKLCREDETPREGWGRRFRETRGVMTSENESCAAPLHIRSLGFEPSEIIAKAILDVEAKWERPDGEWLTTAIEVARVRRQLKLGGFYRWVWPDHVALDDIRRWCDTRRAYRQELTATLRNFGREGMDSPGLIEAAAERGEIHLYTRADWEFCNATIPSPLVTWRWLDESLLTQVVDYLDRSGPVIVFVDNPTVGKRLADMLGTTYFGQGRKAADALVVERGNRHVVASIRAHGTGRNLQAFYRALVVGGPTSGADWEQLLGRLHRAGQLASEVTYRVLWTDEVDRAREDAKFINETTGAPQKLLSAIVDWDGGDK